jgi:hypothetical protein
MNFLPPWKIFSRSVKLLVFILPFANCRQHSPRHAAITAIDPSRLTGEIRIDDWQLSRADTVNGPVSIYHAPHDYVNLKDVFRTDKIGSYYAECILDSQKDQDAALLMGASGKLSVWVNDRSYLTDAPSRTERNENILTVHFTKGKNKIRLRIGDVMDKKTFYLSISSLAYASKLYVLYNASNFLRNSLIAQRDSLVITFNTRLVPVTDSLRVVIAGLNGNTLWKGSLSINAPQPIPLSILPAAGAYYCRMQVADTKFEQVFIYGGHEQLFRKISADLLSHSRTDEDKINTKTLLIRYHHLDSAWKNDGPGNLLDRKIALTLADLQSSLTRFIDKQEGFAHLPGFHLRGFRSEIDGGIDNYMLYVPPSYRRGQPMPLVVIMPFITNQLSFIKSWRVADINGIDMVRHLADQYGYALLSPSSRIYQRCNMNAILDKATFEAIAAVKKDYSIDSTKMYIYGSCVGGLLAFVMADRYPDVFAAAGAKGPEFSYIDQKRSRGIYPDFWLKKNNIIYSTHNFRSTPAYIIHSKIDEKARYDCTKMLVDSIRRSGGTAVLETLEDVSKTKDFDLYPTAEITEKMFGFFKDKQLPPDRIRVPGSDTLKTVTVMSDLFSTGFLVVEGTGGKRNGDIANSASAKTISGIWKNMYHTTCRIKKDIAVTKEDIRIYNLILIGTPSSNIITQKIIGSLSCHISKDSISVNGNVMRGKDLEYTILCPNPLQPGKYILLAGCNDGVTAVKKFDLPYTGWYGYEVNSLSGLLHKYGPLHL